MGYFYRQGMGAYALATPGQVARANTVRANSSPRWDGEAAFHTGRGAMGTADEESPRLDAYLARQKAADEQAAAAARLKAAAAASKAAAAAALKAAQNMWYASVNQASEPIIEVVQGPRVAALSSGGSNTVLYVAVAAVGAYFLFRKKRS